jgi:hypothetical protein
LAAALDKIGYQNSSDEEVGRRQQHQVTAGYLRQLKGLELDDRITAAELIAMHIEGD